MISLRSLRKVFGKTQALAGIDLEIGAGELFAYLGPNGSGKTTTVRILAGLCRPSGGKALIDGIDVVAGGVEARLRCGLVPQHINLDQELSVRQNLEIHGMLFRLGARERMRRAAEVLALMDLQEKGDVLVKKLSGGQKRRVMIARALMHEPRVLFLDEPTVGLDPAIRRRLWAALKTIQQKGTTIFLTTHYIEEAEFLAGRVAFLDAGHLVRVAPPAQLMAEIGDWAVDDADGGQMRSRYFASREAAQAELAAAPQGYTLRRVNLEDAFLALTGRRVAA